MEGLEQTAKLLQMIRERGFKPGDKLPSERDLALEFNMSRSALREGLIRLDTLLLQQIVPRRLRREDAQLLPSSKARFASRPRA